MILLVHMLFGAAIGSLVRNIPLAIILAFLSHYLLDLFPHNEYPIGVNEKNQFAINLSNILKALTDFALGIIFIFIFYNGSSIKDWTLVYICALTANTPDALALINEKFKFNFLKKHEIFHTKKVHFLKYKKIPTFWRILSQVSIFILAIFLLKI